MSSQARITEKLAGTDVRLQDQQYAQLGRELEGADSLEAVLTCPASAQREGRAASRRARPRSEAEAPADQPERPRI